MSLQTVKKYKQNVRGGMDSFYNLFYYYNQGREKHGDEILSPEKFVEMFVKEKKFPERAHLRKTMLYSNLSLRQVNHILTRLLQQHFCTKLPVLLDLRKWKAVLFTKELVKRGVHISCKVRLHEDFECEPRFSDEREAIRHLYEMMESDEKLVGED